MDDLRRKGAVLAGVGAAFCGASAALRAAHSPAAVMGANIMLAVGVVFIVIAIVNLAQSKNRPSDTGQDLL